MMGFRQIKFGEPRRDCLQMILAISKCQFRLLRVDIRQVQPHNTRLQKNHGLAQLM